ncbi:hypothetical protein ACFVY9_00340 [Streptomyces sp. NPDC059544]|uniref:hypothetical protein n=1 Tax=Streptomyces sp. NPDC059544 TaxID=3346861 RepID=UPI00369B8EEA
MLPAARKAVLGAVATALVMGLAACSGGDGSGLSGALGNQLGQIGDGSTSYTGAQPGLARPERLKPGQKPPQFVVFSWDGAGEDSTKLFSHFREVGRKHGITMTYFLSGVYLLPESKAELYDPPRHERGRSDIGFNDTKGIKATVRELRGAWLDGNEIGTHFNGHFCGPVGGGATWTPEEWKSELAQARSFVKKWRTNAGLPREQSLPFDYDRELIGARTPCLEGRDNFLRVAAKQGFRYDSSGISEQIWPDRKHGLWDLSLQMVPVPGRAFETLSMDYNFMINQSGTAKGAPSMHTLWGNQMRDGLIKGFDRAYKGNRAPLIIGNHFESWNGGTYMRAVEQTIGYVCVQRDVRCVSFRQLVDWLDAQDPEVLRQLRSLPVGRAPSGGWKNFPTTASSDSDKPGGSAAAGTGNRAGSVTARPSAGSGATGAGGTGAGGTGEAAEVKPAPGARAAEAASAGDGAPAEGRTSLVWPAAGAGSAPDRLAHDGPAAIRPVAAR